MTGRPAKMARVGRLTASKGIVQLLQEFAALSAFDLHVIGDGELRGELQHEGGALRIVVATGLRAWMREALARRAREGFLRLYIPQHHLKGYLALVESIPLAKGVH
jgi:glycosyltransferase involved in cell wall biosynthesis